jgi:hypothetical protein
MSVREIGIQGGTKMRFLSRLLRRLLPQAKATEPTLVVSPHPLQPEMEHRVAARFPLGVETQVYLADGSVLPCVVKDASREGVRLVVRMPLSRDTVGNLHVFFNGLWLRKDVRVVRSEGAPGQFEIGARFAPWAPQEDALAEGFEKYLRWKAQAA